MSNISRYEIGKDSSWIDHDKNIRYGNISGGIVWPGTKGGFGVIVAREFFEDVRSKEYSYRLLEEFSDLDLRNLIAHMIEFDTFFDKCDKWYGDTSNKTAFRIFRELNKYANIRLVNAPFLDTRSAFSYLIDTISKHISKETLKFSQESNFEAYLNDVPRDSIDKAKFEDFPAIAALGFALSGIGLRKPARVRRGTRQRDRKRNEYDPLHR